MKRMLKDAYLSPLVFRSGYERSCVTRAKATSGDYHGFDVDIGEHD